MSIEALNWARKIYVGDAYGKSVLRAMADYADEHGYCYPSLSRLAQDCDLSVDSVRRRIKLLEEHGIIVTFRCWVDETGKRNSEGRGRETSRDIRLPLDLVRTRSMVEVASSSDAGEEGEGAETDTPLANSKGGLAGGETSQQQGAGSHTARGGVALQPPLELPLNHHLKDSPPNPPPGGGVSEGLTGEAKDLFDGLRADYPDTELWVWQKVAPVFAVLTPAEQRHVRNAAPAYARKVEQNKRKPAPLTPQRFIRERVFENYPSVALPGGGYHEDGSEAARAIAMLYAIAGKLDYFRSVVKRPGVPLFFAKPIDQRLLALARAAVPDAVTLDHRQAAAWEDLLGSYLTVTRHRLVAGARAPWPWPPSIEGKTYDAAAPPTVQPLSDEDADVLAKEGMR